MLEPAESQIVVHHKRLVSSSGGSSGSQLIPTYKLLLVGDPAVGKSNLVGRFANDEFDLWKPPTIGVEFLCRRVELSARPEDAINVRIYDSAGQDTFATLVPAIARQAQAVLVVYDATRRSTFLSVPGWVAQVQRWVGSETTFAVVGNKVDLDKQIEVPEAEAVDLCHRLNCRHFLASARSGQGVADAFLHLVLAIHSLALTRTVVNPVSQLSGAPLAAVASKDVSQPKAPPRKGGLFSSC